MVSTDCQVVERLHRVRETLRRLSSRPFCSTALAFAISDIERLAHAAQRSGQPAVQDIAQRMSDTLRSMPPESRKIDNLILAHVYNLFRQVSAAVAANNRLEAP